MIYTVRSDPNKAIPFTSLSSSSSSSKFLKWP